VSSETGKRKEISKRLQGVEQCRPGPVEGTTICIRGNKYAFTGEWRTPSGAKLPLIVAHHPRDRSKPVIEARTFNQAFKNARAFIRRTKRTRR